jgi:hypothetical protein
MVDAVWPGRPPHSGFGTVHIARSCSTTTTMTTVSLLASHSGLVGPCLEAAVVTGPPCKSSHNHHNGNRNTKILGMKPWPSWICLAMPWERTALFQSCGGTVPIPNDQGLATLGPVSDSSIRTRPRALNMKYHCCFGRFGPTTTVAFCWFWLNLNSYHRHISNSIAYFCRAVFGTRRLRWSAPAGIHSSTSGESIPVVMLPSNKQYGLLWWRKLFSSSFLYLHTRFGAF